MKADGIDWFDPIPGTDDNRIKDDELLAVEFFDIRHTDPVQFPHLIIFGTPINSLKLGMLT